MNFQKIIIVMLSLLTAINTIGIGILIKETKDQTEIALYSTLLTEIAANGGPSDGDDKSTIKLWFFDHAKIRYAKDKLWEIKSNFYGKAQGDIHDYFERSYGEPFYGP